MLNGTESITCEKANGGEILTWRRRTNGMANDFDSDERVVFANESATPRAHDFNFGLDTKTPKPNRLSRPVCFGKLSSAAQQPLRMHTNASPSKWKALFIFTLPLSLSRFLLRVTWKTCRNRNETRYNYVIILARCECSIGMYCVCARALETVLWV